MAEILRLSDEQFATFLRSVPREIPAPESVRRELLHDALAGPWVAHQHVHHNYGESHR